jgi:hypothetical protein
VSNDSKRIAALSLTSSSSSTSERIKSVTIDGLKSGTRAANAPNVATAAALTAAVNPLAGDWLYFITVAPFDTRFTSDINQFNNWKIEYKKNLRDGKFRSKK